jgi:hypothetical protein
VSEADDESFNVRRVQLLKAQNMQLERQVGLFVVVSSASVVVPSPPPLLS